MSDLSDQLIQDQEDVEVKTSEQEKQDHWFIVRARRIYKKGYKDGCCHIHDVQDVPVKFRGHYNAGHTLALYDSEQVA